MPGWNDFLPVAQARASHQQKQNEFNTRLQKKTGGDLCLEASFSPSGARCGLCRPEKIQIKRHQHGLIIFDNIKSMSFTMSQHALVQANDSMHTLGQSATGMYSYNVWLHQIPIVGTVDHSAERHSTDVWMREHKESARFVRVEGKVSIWQPGFATLGFHARMMVILPCHKHCNEHFMYFFDIVMSWGVTFAARAVFGEVAGSLLVAAKCTTPCVFSWKDPSKNRAVF